MITKHIVVEPFDEHWRLDFLKIQNELTDALGQLAISIEHVGSTSVQGLSAKPIIDTDVVIKDYNALKDTISALKKLVINMKETSVFRAGRHFATMVKIT